MRRITTIILSTLMLSGCAAPLGMAAAGLAGGAVTEASTHLGREASARMNLWLWGEEPPPPMELEDYCADGDGADAGHCEPELLLAEYLRRTSPERRERVLAALPPDLRHQMETTLDGDPAPAAGPLPAYGFAPPPPRQGTTDLVPSPLFSPLAVGGAP